MRARPHDRATARNLRRDRTAAALCTWVLRRVATRAFGHTVENTIRSEMSDLSRRPEKYYADAAAEEAEAERGLQLFREAAARADPEKVARMLAHAAAQQGLRMPQEIADPEGGSAS